MKPRAYQAERAQPAQLPALSETPLGSQAPLSLSFWPNGRALVPSEGWYEWVKDPDDPKRKQSYFIRLKSQKPMFFGALAKVHPGLDPHDGDGFVIITAASDQGMVDVHDRKPLVLTPEHARKWIEPGLTPAGPRK